MLFRHPCVLRSSFHFTQPESAKKVDIVLLLYILTVLLAQQRVPLGKAVLFFSAPPPPPVCRLPFYWLSSGLTLIRETFFLCTILPTGETVKPQRASFRSRKLDEGARTSRPCVRKDRGIGNAWKEKDPFSFISLLCSLFLVPAYPIIFYTAET